MTASLYTFVHTCRQSLATQRWDDHRYYHHSRINQSLHLVSAVTGTAHAAAQARAAGYDDAHIRQTSGMIIRPDFYRPLQIDRDAEREALGLDAHRPTGVVMFGGQGSMQMLGIAKALPEVQLILMCGHNEVLARKLRALPAAAPRAVVGFTPEVCRHLQLVDFFIGKPGPGSLSEAVQQGLPVSTFDNAWTMPQERYNAQWVREQGLGLVVKSTRSLRLAVNELLAQLDDFKARARRIDNRAVFEVPELLAELLASTVRAGHHDRVTLAS